ncbi:terminase GpA [Nitrosococcus halophilus Nc 4]|uniref:Terminase GpA n=1 Tax=Nitrosococcus halophilus (strain Nc4) TaxID=472759 RepID=D5BYU4_NITHN|nr:phage terminase large subunit family protein [Nitrosococcus halophilus]ADE14157.1 terminase GpA [Nitrosococcus halophilus Nc 4]
MTPSANRQGKLDASPLYSAFARGIAPRRKISVSQWADGHRVLSTKESAEPGRWRTSRNGLLREPMDCFSARSPVQEVVLKFPIQFGKSSVAQNVLGYAMTERPGPIMVALPAEVSMNKWIVQKLNPMLESTTVLQDVLTSTASRDGANRREFKEFAGGQLYLEHAGSPARLKSTSVKLLIVDELDEFAANLKGGDDPVALLEGRVSAFISVAKQLYIGTPTILGLSRIDEKYQDSDQRRPYVPCPHCGHQQPLEWKGLQWLIDETKKKIISVAYVCRDCGALIDESHKPQMLANARWVPENPGHWRRGYTANCLYYPVGLGPNWKQLAQNWLEVQDDPARLKTFVNDRLAETWEDPTTRLLRHNAIAERAQPYPLRTAPEGVLAVTAGVDTQDNRLEAVIIGWGRKMRFWVLDYAVLYGDPAEEGVWTALTDLLNRPLQHENGALLQVLATAIDMGGHRTEAVKSYVRDRRIARPMAIKGASANTAPILGKPTMADVDWRGRYDKRGVMIYQVGTVAAKHWLYARLSRDTEKEPEQRLCHFSSELPPEFFPGLTAETYNPAKNRFELKRNVRNEPLDTTIYSFAAAHHPELRLHRATHADWDRYQRLIQAQQGKNKVESRNPTPTQPTQRPRRSAPRPVTPSLGNSDWNSKL